MGSAPFARKFAERRVSAVALATTLSRCEEAGGGKRLVLKEHEAYRFASGFRSRWNSTPSWALAAAPAGGQQERGRGGVPGPAAPAEERGVPVGSVPPGAVCLHSSGAQGWREGTGSLPGWAPHPPLRGATAPRWDILGERKDKNLNRTAGRCGRVSGCGHPVPGPQTTLKGVTRSEGLRKACGGAGRGAEAPSVQNWTHDKGLWLRDWLSI